MAANTDMSRLLLLLYEGVSTPGQMPAFLHALAQSVGAKGAVLREHSYHTDGRVRVETASLSATVGYSEEALRLYREHFYQRDVYLQRVLEDFSTADCGASQVLLPRSELKRTELYDGYMKPFDIGPMMWAKLAEQPGYHSSISLVRHNNATFFDQTELELLTALTPHLRQALHLNKTLHALKASNAMLSQGLEETGIAICIVRQDGSVLKITEGAERILAKRDGIWLRRGRLELAVRSEQSALNTLIATAAEVGAKGSMEHPMPTKAKAAGNGSIASWTARAGGALLVSRKHPLRALQVVITPFCPGSLLNEAEATALVQFTDPLATPKRRAAVLRALYKLTPSEARIADLLLQGLEVREIADTLGNTLETTRFHIKKVLSKTGTRRQTELIRLMMSLSITGEA